MKISQREARRLRKRVDELERVQAGQRQAWAREYPGGTHLLSFVGSDVSVAMIQTARRLGHAVVVVERGNELRFFGLLP